MKVEHCHFRYLGARCLADALPGSWYCKDCQPPSEEKRAKRYPNLQWPKKEPRDEGG
jgi:hypothetical protein